MRITLADVRRALDGTVRHSTRSDWTSRTRAVTTALCTIAREKGFDTCARFATEARWGEYLLDVLILRTRDSDIDGQPQVILQSPLAAECEWGDLVCVTHDFRKLLLIRADLRLMIFRARTTAEALETIDHLLSYARAYRRCENGDRYVFAAYCPSANSFFYKQKVIPPRNRGAPH